MPQGPNENDCTTLKDGKTILTVIRKDGGDGVPHHKHVPYFFATSKDEAASWTLREVNKPPRYRWHPGCMGASGIVADRRRRSCSPPGRAWSPSPAGL